MNQNCFIGITGGIGSGKSSVSRFWSSYAGLPLIDIDKGCRELLEIGMPGWVALKENFGGTFFDSDGNLDRPRLRSAIFADDGLRQSVDMLIHPLALDDFLRKAEKENGPVLVDVPLLFEAGWKDCFLHTVVVYADRQTCCRRVSARDDISPGEALSAIRVQMDLEKKMMLADHVVDNRYCWLMTRTQVVRLSEWFTELYPDLDRKIR